MFASTMRALTLFLALAAPAAAAQLGATPATREGCPAPAGFTPGSRVVNGVKLHYLQGGSGPLVLLVHGFGQTWYEWRQLMQRLARTRTMIADSPGLGGGDGRGGFDDGEALQIRQYASNVTGLALPGCGHWLP